MAYRVTFRASADKAIDKLPASVQSRVVKKAIALADNPRPPGSSKLSGTSDLWRIRIGDYRIVYVVDDQIKVVDIRIIAHRREVYRGL